MNENDKQAEPVATDWERIARVQDAKLRAMCGEPGGFEKLCEVLDRYEKAQPVQPAVAQGEPVAYTNKEQLGYLKDPKYSAHPMAMWTSKSPGSDIALYTEAPAGAQGEPVAHYGIVDPDYARVFTQARCIAWQYGYTCVMHGSFTRDLDLLMVPWTEQAKDNREQMLKLIAMACELRFSDGKEDVIQSKADFTQQPHGRTSCSLHFPSFGDRRWIDVSFFPVKEDPAAAINEHLLEALKSTGLFLHHCWCDVQMNDYSFEKLGKQMEIVDAAIAEAEKAKGSKHD